MTYIIRDVQNVYVAYWL